VSEPTVTATVKRLARLGLLEHIPYRGVRLAPDGEKIALEVIRHHRLLELYLVQALGLSWDQVHEEADRLEHTISELVEDRMDEVLGHPSSDPHGHPIPNRNGDMDPVPERSLLDLDVGESATVRRVPDRDPALLQYLDELGIVPEAAVTSLGVAPFGGPVAVRVGGKEQALGRETAGAIRVGSQAVATSSDRHKPGPKEADEYERR
jgi:DtxR family Mn-dependent transcriptional regulator